MAKGTVTAEKENDTHSQAMEHIMARNCPLLVTRRGVESELVTAACNVQMQMQCTHGIDVRRIRMLTLVVLL